MRTSRARTIREEVTKYAKKHNLNFTKGMYRWVKRLYNSTPRTERQEFFTRKLV